MSNWNYQRRYYRRPAELAHDLRALLRERSGIKALRRGAPIDRAFQERLMLAETEVNGCRYCAYAHARMALAAGVSRADVDALAGGDLRASEDRSHRTIDAHDPGGQSGRQYLGLPVVPRFLRPLGKHEALIAGGERPPPVGASYPLPASRAAAFFSVSRVSAFGSP